MANVIGKLFANGNKLGVVGKSTYIPELLVGFSGLNKNVNLWGDDPNYKTLVYTHYVKEPTAETVVDYGDGTAVVLPATSAEAPYNAVPNHAFGDVSTVNIRVRGKAITSIESNGLYTAFELTHVKEDGSGEQVFPSSVLMDSFPYTGDDSFVEKPFLMMFNNGIIHLTSLYIPSPLKVCAGRSFRGRSGSALTSLVLPETLYSILAYAFQLHSKLTSIVCTAFTPVGVAGRAFTTAGVETFPTVYVPDESLPSYQRGSVNRRYLNCVNDFSTYFGANCYKPMSDYLPQGKFVEYIDFAKDGAYIDTGYTPSSDDGTVVEIDAIRTASAIIRPFGVPALTSVITEGRTMFQFYAYIGSYSTSSNLLLASIQYDTTDTSVSSELRGIESFKADGTLPDVIIGDRFKMRICYGNRAGRIYLDRYRDGVAPVHGETVVYCGRLTPLAGMTLWFGSHVPLVKTAQSSSQNYAARVREFKVWRGANLMRRFRAAVDANGTPCFWETVEQKFYYNLAEVGTMTAGPDLEG